MKRYEAHRRTNLLAVLPVLLSFVAGRAGAQVDVIFQDDFENMVAGAAPAMFLPAGSGNPDWDNQILNPLGNGIVANEIVSNAPGNTTKTYKLEPFSTGKPLLLGASFNPSSDRYVIVEYDAYVVGQGTQGPAAEIIYADGYGDLDGTGGSTKIAIHLEFSLNKISGCFDGGGLTGFIYRVQGEDNNVTTSPPLNDAGFYEYTTGIPWSKTKWYRVQVIADQQGGVFDLKITDQTPGGLTYTQTNLPFNDPSAGYLRKVWFMQSEFHAVYFDNIIVYQTGTQPPVSGPTVIFRELSKGPVKTNTGLDIDFFDDTDLQSIQYKIGAGVTWTDLTSDGTTAYNLSGAGDASMTAPVMVTDADFTAMAEGQNPLHFKAEDNAGHVTESAAILAFWKDTQPPNLASVTVPASETIPSLTAIQGLASDAVSGLAANGVTFTLQRSDDLQYWSGTTWQAGAVSLPTTHPASAGGAGAGWSNSGALPVLTDIAMSAQASVNDALGNGVFTGAPLAFTVVSGSPSVALNVSSVGPVRSNAFAAIDVDFADDVDLLAIQYKIGPAGAWTDLTTDGIAVVDLSGAADTSATALVYLQNGDFSAMPEGQSGLYLRAVDNLGNAAATSTPVAFMKDTVAPSLMILTTPSTNPFSSLPTVAGQMGDAAGGSGFAANNATFTIQRGSDGLYWTGASWGALTHLAATHAATTDASAVPWMKNAAIPPMSQLAAGITYTFGIALSDRAGNAAGGSYATVFADVPEVASITAPADGLVTATPFSSLAVQGQAGDHESGYGLNANSTTFTLQRSADGWYWNGTAWQAGNAALATTHSQTSSSSYAVWSSASTLPGAGVLQDGAYVLRARATNRNGGFYDGQGTTVNYSGTPPLIVSATMAPTNAYITLTFSEKVWSDAAKSTALMPSDFTVTFQQNGGGLTGSTITGFYGDSGLTTPLSSIPGYSTVYAALSITGGGATGVERIALAAVAGAVYDVAGVAMSSAETTGPIAYNPSDTTPPSIGSRETADLDGDGAIDAIHVTFSEPVSDSTVTAAGFDVEGATLTGEAFSPTTNGDTQNDSDIYITFTQNASYKTDALPSLTVAAGAVKDLAGNAIAANGPVGAVDKAGPAILSAAAGDGASIRVGIDADDTVTITFSENTSKPAITAGSINTALALSGGHGWLDGSSAIGSAGWNAAGNVLTVTLSAGTLAPTVAVGDTITLGGGPIGDGAGNGPSTAPFSAIGGTFSADTTPPIVAGVVTRDMNGNGFIDRLEVTFSENVDGTTIVAGSFNASSVGVTGVVDDGAPGNAVIWVNLADNVLYTNAMPALTLAAGGIQDLPGNPNLPIGAFSSTDGAAPVVMSVTAGTGSPALRIRFSEPVGTSAGGSGDLVTTDFTYGNNSGGDVSGISSMAPDANGTDDVVTITMNLSFASADFLPTPDAMAAAANQIFDLSSNPAATTSVNVMFSDTTAPTIVSRDTADLDGDGLIDAIHITFSEPVQDSTVTAAGFDVAGASGEAFGSTTNGDTPNDADIYIAFTESVSYGTDALPSLTVAAGSVSDLAANAILADGPVAATDKAPPIILSRETADLDGDGTIDAVTLIFSEAVQDSTVTAGAFAFSGGVTATGVSTGAAVDDAAVAILFTDGVLATDAAPSVSYTPGGLADPAGNLLASTGALACIDKAPPTILSRETADLNGDGTIDAVRLLFSEAVKDSTVTAGAFTFSGGVAAMGVSTGAAVDDAAVTIRFTDGVLKTDAMPTAGYAAGGLADMAGNLLASAGALACVDKAPPTVSSVMTRDLNGNGSIDRLEVTFNENVNAATILAPGFGVPGIGIADVTDDGVSGNAVIWVSLTDSVLASDAMPALTIAPGGIKDLPGNANALIGAYGSTDGAGPAILSAAAGDGAGIRVGIDADDTVTITFSENTSKPAITAGNIATALALSGGHGWLDGASAIGPTGWNAAGNVLTVTLSVGSSAPTVAVGDTITLGGGLIGDGAGNGPSPAAFSAIGGTFSADIIPPEILSAMTRDLNGNGCIDAVMLTFSEAVKDSTVTAGAFTFSGGVTAAVVGTGAAADDAAVTIGFTDGVLTTDATPSVSYTQGGLADLAGNLMAATGAVATGDGAGPAILSAAAGDGAGIRVGIDADDTVTITFSENTSKPAITAGNIATALALSGGHGWLDGASAIGPTGWNAAGNVLTVTLSVGSSAPTVAVGDTITLGGGLIGDGAGNGPSPAAFSAIGGDFGVDTTPPSLSSLITADADGDGTIDRIVATFDEPIDPSTIVPGSFTVSEGTIDAVVDDGVSGNATLWVKLSDGALPTDAVPKLTIAAGGVNDLAGNPNVRIDDCLSVDGAPPAVLLTLAVAGERAVYVRFSEPVSGNGSEMDSADFAYSDIQNAIRQVVLMNPVNGYVKDVFIYLEKPLSAPDVLLPRTLGTPPDAIADSKLLSASSTPHNVSDLLLGLVQPVWAHEDATGITVKEFDGSGYLGHGNLTIQVQNPTGKTAELYYGFTSPTVPKANTMPLPEKIFEFLLKIDQNAQSARSTNAQEPLVNFTIPASMVKKGVFEFVIRVNNTYSVRVANPKDPRTLTLWSFMVNDIKQQRGNVSILSNVINPGRGEKTKLAYVLPARGAVTILVSDQKGDLVAVLVREVQDAGSYSVDWDGKNRGGRAVAPGLYFIKIVGPEVDEIRKVLVTSGER